MVVGYNEAMNKSKILKRSAAGISIVGLICLCLCVDYIRKGRSFDDAADIAAHALPDDWAENIKIGVIGDSWVAGQKLDQPIKQALLASGVEVEVVSSGQPGSKSRQIYRNLLASKQDKYSSSDILLDEDVD